MSFSDSNQSLQTGLPNFLSKEKRKPSVGAHYNATPEKRLRRTDSNSSATASPTWETKKLKIDLIAAEAQIIKLESSVAHYRNKCEEMQILFEKEKASLVERRKESERALSITVDSLKLICRNNLELKDEKAKAAKISKEIKTIWDADRMEFHKQIAELKDKLFETNHSYNDQIFEMKKEMNKLLQALDGAQFEVEILKKEVAKQTGRAEHYTTLRSQLEIQTFELQQVTGKLKELEYERDSYKDWVQQSKTAEKRLGQMTELSKEVRASELSLREAVCNKLLLEEQVYQLTTKLEILQPVQEELHKAKVKIASLKEWESAARELGIDSSQLITEVAKLKEERDKAIAQLTDQQTVRESLDSVVNRLALVAKERDSYRQHLDCYEKELTVILYGMTGVGSGALLSARVEQMEKSLRDCDQHAHIKVVENLLAEVNKWLEDAEAAKREAQKMRVHRDCLQAHMESLTSRTVLSRTDNPSAATQKVMNNIYLEAALEEVKRLRTLLNKQPN